MRKDGFPALTFSVAVGVVAFLAVAVLASLARESAFRENDCLFNHLRIEGAKYQWALQNGKKIGDEVPEREIIPLIVEWLDCPSGGKYSYGAVGSETICSVHKERELAHPR